MAGPWEKYAQQSEQSGPWTKYGAVSTDASAKPEQKTSLVDGIKQGAASVVQGVGDLVAGGVRGAGSIGATILYPWDKAQDLYYGDRNPTLSGLVTGKRPLSRNEERRQQMDEGLRTLGANPDSLLFKGGKLGGEIAGTAGAGSLVANGLRAAPVLVNAVSPGAVPVVTNLLNKAEPLLNAISTSGMSTGGAVAQGGKAVAKNVLTRAAGGAITGGVSAGLVDPEQAGSGALVGGALPPALMAAGKVGSAIGGGTRSLTKNVLGLTTGVGAEPISQAFKAGQTGNKAFLDNLKGDVPLTDVLDQAKAGLQAMNAAKSAEYRSGMIPIKGDQSVLSLKGISKAVDDAAAITTFKGQVKNEAANKAVEKMRAVVDEWKALDPAEFHTPEGLDALKQKLGGIIEGIPFEEKTARTAASKVYNATKAEIEAQAPTYAKVMKDYHAASDQISEIERALSLGKKSSADTAMRKLQSLMRNNVQTNYGNRLTLANALQEKGGADIMPALSGQALNSWTPRSLSGQIGAGASMLGAMTNPFTLAALPVQSPRLVGSLAYGAGRLSGGAGNALAAGAGQGNKLAQILNDPSMVAQFGYRSAPALVADR